MKKVGLLPVLALVALGVWLWKGAFGLLPAERELSWSVPGEWATIRALELQLWDDATLLKREELHTPAGLMREPQQKISLKGGVPYRARLFVTRDSGQEAYQATITVGDTVSSARVHCDGR